MEAPVIDGFRHRGHHHVSRIESFSDTVFAFSLTLLVVSLTVPRTFDELLRTIAGFPAFAVSFALLAQIWYYQHRFFRRYGLTDRTTIALNIALLFVVLFYTYPLKFLFASLLSLMSNTTDVMRPEQTWELFLVYGLGYAAMFFVFVLLYRHALGQKETLELTPREVFQTRFSIAFSVLQIGVAVLSVLIALGFTQVHAYALAGFCGGMIYPVGITLGSIMIRRAYRDGGRGLESTAP
ncbi:MAG: DUF1211 domain-containing protein [Candidatus Eremiobacteraeota bacterium]|nr:DUF1211 domain-containing protein [Candidatus Eremiobacteraeota bacterium]MBV9647378.1 DUF1211 domain-containing protein [Candidatus Eremiobacteraeota bacterium]